MAPVPYQIQSGMYFIIIVTMASSCHPGRRLRTGALRHSVAQFLTGKMEPGAPCLREKSGIMQQNIFEMLMHAPHNLILFCSYWLFYMTFHSPVASIARSAS